jgi:hypothetical protein
MANATAVVVRSFATKAVVPVLVIGFAVKPFTASVGAAAVLAAVGNHQTDKPG